MASLAATFEEGRNRDTTEGLRRVASALYASNARFQRAVGGNGMTESAYATARSELAVMAELLKQAKRELK